MTTKYNWWVEILDIENDFILGIEDILGVVNHEDAETGDATGTVHPGNGINYALLAVWIRGSATDKTNIKIYIQFESKTTIKQVQKLLNCDFRILEVIDGKGGKAIEENPFLKIWATKLSAYRVTEFGNLDDVRKKGRKTEFRSGPDARTSPRLSEESKLAAKRKVEELKSDPLTLFKKMSDEEKIEAMKDLLSSKKAKERGESEEPAPARAAKMEIRPHSSRPISSPYKRDVNLELSKKIEVVEDKKPEAVSSISKAKNLAYTTPKSTGPSIKPTPPVSSAIINQDEKLDKFKTEVDTRFLKVQQEIGNVNSNMENWMKQLMERLPSKATEDPVKLEGKKVESKGAKNDETPIPEWEFSSDGDNNDEDEHNTKIGEDI